MIVVSAKEMSYLDQETIRTGYGSAQALMETAGIEAAREIAKDFPDKKTRVLVACGPGNNGGDGYVIAYTLDAMGYSVGLLVTASEDQMSPAAKYHFKQVKPSLIQDISQVTYQADVYVDALFGISLSRPLEGLYARIIEAMNDHSGVIYGIDMPSGVMADTGEIKGIATKCHKTITFEYPKLGHYLFPGKDMAGQVVVCPIGLSPHVVAGFRFNHHLLSEALLADRQAPIENSHKGTFGSLLIVAGSKGMCGAAILAGQAAYRSGVGLVHLLVESGNALAIHMALPEAIVTTFEPSSQVEAYEDLMDRADAILIGPGLSETHFTKKLLEQVFDYHGKKVVLDAGALNMLSHHMEWLAFHKLDLVMTPHIGEMRRLTGLFTDEILRKLCQTAEEFYEQYNVVTVLKSARTVVVDNEGTWLNTMGHYGMATAGSGDVLGGIIASLMAQGMASNEAARLGTYLHSLAAVKALEWVNPPSMMARDLVKGLRKTL